MQLSRFAPALVLLAGAAAQIAGDARTAQSLFPPAHPYVDVTGVLESHKNNVVPMGDIGTVLAGFVNGGEKGLNISGIMAALWSPDLSVNYHNFTAAFVNEIVDAGVERTLEYRFLMPFMPAGTEVMLVAAVFYQDVRTRREYSSVFFNSTLTVTAGDRPITIRSIIPWLLGAAASSVALYVVRDLVLPQGKRLAGRGAGGGSGGEGDDIASIDVSKSKARKRKAAGGDDAPKSS